MCAIFIVSKFISDNFKILINYFTRCVNKFKIKRYIGLFFISLSSFRDTKINFKNYPVSYSGSELVLIRVFKLGFSI